MAGEWQEIYTERVPTCLNRGQHTHEESTLWIREVG